MARHRPARVLSLLSPQQAPPATAPGVQSLALRFNDIAAPAEGLIAPDDALVAQILAFGAAWTEPAPMLVHCWMGISRSPAAAIALACALGPARDEHEVAEAVRGGSPSATPNPLIVELADRQLGRGGRLVTAVKAIGRGAEASTGEAFVLPVRGYCASA